VQQKAENVILAPCLPLEDQPEYKMVEELTHEKVTATPKQREKIRERLVRLLKNDRNGFDGNRFQPDRYSYLPGTFFLPDLVVDFQALVRVSVECLKLEDRIASLDSPFAEACLARFTRYYGRLGTPDLDYAYALERVLASIAASQGEPAA